MGKRKHSHGGAMVGISDPVFTPPNAPLSKNNYSCDTCGVRLKDWDPKKILRCIRCAEEIDCWHKATSWSELLQYNREFVRNKRRSTAYAFNQQVFRYPGLTNSLLRLHDYGCLTLGAGPGEHTMFQKDPKSKPPGRWQETKDRAWVRFLLPTNHPRIHLASVRMLQLQLTAIKDIEMVCYYEYTEYEPGKAIADTNNVRCAEPILTIADLEDAKTTPPSYKHFLSTIQPRARKSADRCMSKVRTANTKQDLKHKGWTRSSLNQLTIITEADIPEDSQGKRGFGVELPVSKQVRPIIISVCFKQWPPEPKDVNLGEILELAMLTVGIQPLFKEEDELTTEEAKRWHKPEPEHKSTADAIADRIRALDLQGLL